LFPRERLLKEADELIAHFLRDIRHLEPRCVIIFGSYVKGNFTESSDLDICVISRKLPEDEMSRRNLVGVGRISKIKAIGFYPEEFLQHIKAKQLLVYDIISEGKLILDDGFYETARNLYDTCVKNYGLVKDEKGWKVGRRAATPS